MVSSSSKLTTEELFEPLNPANVSSPAVRFFLDLNMSTTPAPELVEQSVIKPVRDEELAKVEVGVLLLLFTLASIGNLIVILGIYFRHQKISRMYLFILHLSIADLITAVFNVATQLFMEITWPHFHGGDALCKFVKYTQILGPYSSSYVLVMTAFDRYQAICFPLSSYKRTTKRSKIMLTFAWSIAFLFCIPQLFIFSIKETYDGVYDCYAEFTGSWGVKTYVTWYSISFFIVPLLLLTFAYTCICRTLWLSSNAQALGKVEFHTIGQARRNCRLLSQSSNSSDEVAVSRKILGATYRLFGRREMQELLPNLKKIEASSSIIRGPIPTSSTSHYLNSLSGRQRQSSGIGSLKSNLDAVNPSAPAQVNNENVGGVGGNYSESVTSPTNYGNGDRADIAQQESNNLTRSTHKSPVRYINQWNFVSKNGATGRISSPVQGSACAGVSKAKIKTVKITITVILCYIICSSPFIAAQLWSVYDPFAYQSPFYTGATFTILTLLASLNSCVNPYIFLFFNPNLLHAFLKGLTMRNVRELRRQKLRASAETMRTLLADSRRMHIAQNANAQFNQTNQFKV